MGEVENRLFHDIRNAQLYTRKLIVETPEHGSPPPHRWASITIPRRHKYDNPQETTRVCDVKDEDHIGHILQAEYRCHRRNLSKKSAIYIVDWRTARKLRSCKVAQSVELITEPCGSRDRVFIKVLDITRPGSEQGALRESATHRAVSTDGRGGLGVRGMLPTIWGHNIVPQFYFSMTASYFGPHGDTTVHLIAQECVEGHTLHDARAPEDDMEHRRLLRQVFFDIEKQVKGLWLLGFAHGDLHSDNIMLTYRGPTYCGVRLVDLGMAVRIRDEELCTMRAHMSPWTDIAAWMLDNDSPVRELRPFIRDAHAQRGLIWFNDDAKHLLKYYRDANIDTSVGSSIFHVQLTRYSVWWPRHQPGHRQLQALNALVYTGQVLPLHCKLSWFSHFLQNKL